MYTIIVTVLILFNPNGTERARLAMADMPSCVETIVALHQRGVRASCKRVETPRVALTWVK